MSVLELRSVIRTFGVVGAGSDASRRRSGPSPSVLVDSRRERATGRWTRGDDLAVSWSRRTLASGVAFVVVVASLTAAMPAAGAGGPLVPPANAVDGGLRGTDVPTGTSAGRAGVEAAAKQELATALARRESLASPSAVALRRDSRTAYKGLVAAASRKLLSTAFPELLPALKHSKAESPAGAQVTRYLDDFSAIIDFGAGRREMIRSTLPLRRPDGSNNRQPVNLDLEASATGFKPVNPLVATGLPKTLSDGFTVGDEGVRLRLASGGGVAEGVVSADRLVSYHDAALDTDALAAPTPRGMELFFLLRSELAPERFPIDVDGPVGATFELDADGSARIVDGDRTLGRVAPPRAHDAQGRDVTVNYALDSSGALSVRVAHRDRDLAWPVLVDPEIQMSWSWYHHGSPADWTYASNNDPDYSYPALSSCYTPLAGAMCPGAEGYYLYARNTVRNGSWGEYFYDAPGATSYVTSASFGPTWYSRRSDLAEDPYLFMGIWSTEFGNWVDLRSFPGVNLSGAYTSLTSGTRQDGDSVAFGMYSRVTRGMSDWREAYHGGAVVNMSDPDSPTVAAATPFPTEWTREASLNVASNDQGLGMASLTLTADGVDTATWKADAVAPCAEPNGLRSKCSPDLSLTAATRGLPSGEHTVRADARDILGHSTPKTWPLKIDTLPPYLARATGDITDDDVAVDGTQTYLVGASGEDDMSGVRRFVIERAGQEIAGASLPCDEPADSPSSCSRSATAEVPLNTQSLPEGLNSLALITIDDAGNRSDPFMWDVLIDRSAPGSISDIDASYVGARSATFVSWNVPPDAVHPDGSPGSGIASYRYRYNRNGTWSSFNTSMDFSAELPGGSVGDVVAFEVFAIDRAGNTGPPASFSATASEGNDSAITDADADADETAARGVTVTSLVRCAFQKTISAPERFSAGGREPNNAVRGDARVFCQAVDPADEDAVEAASKTSVRLMVCVEFTRDGGLNWGEVDCKSRLTTGPTAARPLSVSAAELCRPGLAQYRIKASIYARFPGAGFYRNFVPRYGSTALLGCNEAGAFRRLAERRGDASFFLGVALTSNDAGAQKDPLPPGPGGGRRGWAAHHIAPAGEGKGLEVEDQTRATEAQGLMYSCNIEPNEAANGVWLRNTELRSPGAAYDDLPEAFKRRPYHPRIHTDAYYATVVRFLDNSGSVGACRDANGMRTSLNSLKERIKTGEIDREG